MSSGQDAMDRWQHYIDRELEQLMKDTENLPGAGKPLKLRHDENVPNDMRMAFKIMADNDLAPDWVLSGKALEQKQQRLMKTLQRAAQDYISHRFANGEQVWKSACRKFTDEVKAYNSELLSHNLKLPQGINHLPMLNAEKEIARALRA